MDEGEQAGRLEAMESALLALARAVTDSDPMAGEFYLTQLDSLGAQAEARGDGTRAAALRNLAQSYRETTQP